MFSWGHTVTIDADSPENPRVQLTGAEATGWVRRQGEVHRWRRLPEA